MSGAVCRGVARCHAEINSTERHYGIPVPASPCLSGGQQTISSAASITTHCGGGEGVRGNSGNVLHFLLLRANATQPYIWIFCKFCIVPRGRGGEPDIIIALVLFVIFNIF